MQHIYELCNQSVMCYVTHIYPEFYVIQQRLYINKIFAI